jgi:hypothetical protein
MFIKTLLNFVTNYKSFRFGNVSFLEKGTTTQHIIAEIFPRKNSQPFCPQFAELLAKNMVFLPKPFPGQMVNVHKQLNNNNFLPTGQKE